MDLVEKSLLLAATAKRKKEMKLKAAMEQSKARAEVAPVVETVDLPSEATGASMVERLMGKKKIEIVPSLASPKLPTDQSLKIAVPSVEKKSSEVALKVPSLGKKAEDATNLKKRPSKMTVSKTTMKEKRLRVEEFTAVLAASMKSKDSTKQMQKTVRADVVTEESSVPQIQQSVVSAEVVVEDVMMPSAGHDVMKEGPLMVSGDEQLSAQDVGAASDARAEGATAADERVPLEMEALVGSHAKQGGRGGDPISTLGGIDYSMGVLEEDEFVGSLFSEGGGDQIAAGEEVSSLNLQGAGTLGAPTEDLIQRRVAEEGLALASQAVESYLLVRRAQGELHAEASASRGSARGTVGGMEMTREGYEAEDHTSRQSDAMQLTGRTEKQVLEMPAVRLRQIEGLEISSADVAPAESNIPFSAEQIKFLKDLMAQSLRDHITDGWAPSAFKRRLDSTVMGHELMLMRHEDLSASLLEVKETARTATQYTPTIIAIGKDQEVLRAKVQKWDEETVSRTKIAADLKSDVDKALTEYEAVKSENINLGVEFGKYREDHKIDHRGICGRLEGLEESRRKTDIQSGTIDLVEANKLKMEGFELCLNSIISRGYFPRELLEDRSWMSLIKDKDGLYITLEKYESQRRLTDASSSRGQQDVRTYQQRGPLYQGRQAQGGRGR